MQFLNNLEINRNSLINPVIDPRTGTTPSTPVEGQMYYDMDTHDMWFRDNTTWVQFGTGGGSVVSVSGAEGIASSGGVNPIISLAIEGLGVGVLASGDSFVFADLDGAPASLSKKLTATGLVTYLENGTDGINHDAIRNYDANKHVDHTGVTITAGNGLSYSTGGTDISVSATIDLNINELTVATVAGGDFVPFWDITATATNKKTTFTNFEAVISHANIAGKVANEHIDHTSVTITAGSGLNYSVGGTDISADATMDLDINGLTTLATPAAGDLLAFYDIAGSPGNKKLTFANLATYIEGGIDLTFGIAGTTGTGTVATSQTLTVLGTALQMATSASGQTITIAFTNDVTMPNDLTVTGDLTVNGTTVTANVDTFVVEDPLVKFGNNNAADSVDLGTYWEHTATGSKWGGMFRDASDGNKAITFFEDLEVEPTTTVNIGGAGYTLADVKFGTVRSGTWNGTVVITTYGGTGLASYTAGDILYYSAGTVLSKLSASNGFLKMTGSTPAWSAIDLTADVGATILPRANGGTGISTAPTNGQVLIGTTSGGAWSPGTIGAANTTGTGAEGSAVNWNIGAGTLTLNAKYATTSLSGVVSIALNSEVVTGTSTLLMVTPANLTNWETQANYRVARKYSTTMTGASSQFDITHGLGGNTKELIVHIYDTGNTYEQIFADVEHLSTTQIRIKFSQNVGSETYQVVVIG